MLSLSVTIISFPFEVDIPIRAKIFKYSCPNAPAPIKNILVSSIFFWISLPKIAIWSSYLEFFNCLSTFLPKFSTISKKSKINHWFIGIYNPVYFIISCDTIPPKKEHIGDICALAQLATISGIFCSHFCIFLSQIRFPFFLSSSYNSFVLFTISSTWDLLFNSGKELFLEKYSCRAKKIIKSNSFLPDLLESIGSIGFSS